MFVMLGGFHLLMSFLGSVDGVMKGSGLEDALEQIHGKSTVSHVISGKAVSRALRGHFLVKSALVSQLLEPLISIENNFEQEEMENEICTMPRKAVIKIDDLLIETENMTDAVKERKLVDFNLQQYSSLLKLKISLEEYKKSSRDSSRTAKLWLQ